MSSPVILPLSVLTFKNVLISGSTNDLLDNPVAFIISYGRWQERTVLLLTTDTSCVVTFP